MIPGYMSGTNLREMREAYRMTPQELAGKLGVPLATYIAWEESRIEVPRYLYDKIKPIGYQAIIEHNQPILDQYRVGMKEYGTIHEGLGLPKGYTFKVSDAHDRRVGWHIVKRDGYFAVGETDGGLEENGTWAGYAIPASAETDVELRHPDATEMPR